MVCCSTCLLSIKHLVHQSSCQAICVQASDTHCIVSKALQKSKKQKMNRKLVLKFVKLFISWALPSRQPHRVTSGRMTQSPFFHTSWKTPVRKAQRRGWIPILDPRQHQTLPSHRTVKKKDISVWTFHLNDYNWQKAGDCLRHWRVCCLVRRDARPVGCAN